MNTPILIIMFTRYETLGKVFEQIRKVKPKQLYLYQDGPRDEFYDQDILGIRKCREIVSNIDWPCSVVTKYKDKNIGCDPGSFYAYKWFFSQVDQGIILEDDVVPSVSFFEYCEELLTLYKDNKKVYRICGVNHEGISKVDSSYFFSRKGATGSWASWKRVANMWDESYSFLDDEKIVDELRTKFENEDYFEAWLSNAISHKNSGKAFYETILYENKIINDMLDIIPSRNLVTNIGITNDAVHTKSINQMPHALRRCFNAPRYELDFPLVQPSFIEENMHYTYVVNKIMGWGHPCLRFFRKWESRVRRFIYGSTIEKKEYLKKLFMSRRQNDNENRR